VLSGEDFTQIYGGEAIYHEGKVLTRVRSGGYGFTVKKNILLAYLPIDLAKPGTKVDVELIEGMRVAEVTASVLYDPKGEKLKS
jgi:glycine cleavage system aminomethyltransferase T